MSGTGILALDAIASATPQQVGNKALSLARLAAAGLPVPRGFCLPVRFCSAHARSVDGVVRLDRVGRERLLHAWRYSGLRLAAVRSSAPDEDCTDASAAGLYLSRLGIGDASGLIDAVEACIASLDSPAARCHRARHGGAPAIAVLVQELVEADAAGVLFTVDPLDGCSETRVVNAIPGLGEPLVSGQVDGDLFRLDRRGRLRASRISRKPTRLTASGPRPVPADAQHRPALSAAELARLSALGDRVEALLGERQDIEFALSEGHFAILQARPIPPNGCRDGDLERYLRRERARLRDTIEGLRACGRLRERPAILSNGNIAELLPTPTPMSFGLFERLFGGREGAIAAGRIRLGYQIAPDAADGLFHLVAGEPYFVLEIDARSYEIGLGEPVAHYLRQVEAEPHRANYPEVGLYEQHLSLADAVVRYGEIEGPRQHAAREAFQARLRRKAAVFAKRFEHEIEPALIAWTAQERATDAARCDGLLAQFDRRLDHLRRVTAVEFVIAARLGFCFADRLRMRLREALPDAGDRLLLNLLQALDGSLVSRQLIDLERLARGRLSTADFLRHYGHLAPNELELSLPRYHECPGMLRRQLSGLELDRDGAPSEAIERFGARRREAERELDRALRAAGATARVRDGISADLGLAQRFLPLRETLKYYLAAEYDLLRRTLLRLAPAIGWRADDLFYLTPDEIPRLDDGDHRAALAACVATRRAERQQALRVAQRRPLPGVLFAEREQPFAGGDAPADGRLHGTAVAPGEVVGEVVLLEEGSCSETTLALLDRRHVVVTRSANLGLAPLLRKVGGLVVEVGGVLAHSACQAREAGIPAVVLPRATRLLVAGERIRLNGSAGCVSRLRPVDASAPHRVVSANGWVPAFSLSRG